jgi:hypothetical protein
MGEWENGRMGEWENGRMGEWENGRMGEWANGRTENAHTNCSTPMVHQYFSVQPKENEYISII